LRPFTASALLASAALTLTAQPSKSPHAAIASAPSKPSTEKTTALPVTRVALYKNGVGFFEHSGSVSGDQTVTIDFTTAQLNDVLQSLTAIDLNGGHITGAGYNSSTPLDQQLKSLPLALSEDPSTTDLYSAIRGARVEVAGSGSAFSGRILNIEIRSVPSPTENSRAMEKRFLTVISDAGAIRSLELTAATQVRLLDSSLHSDLSRYLELIAANRSEGLRHLALRDNGTGTRQLRVSYISEVPIWKSTYRILLTDSPLSTASGTATLQGWAVVDNTVGTDWNHVQLSLIAGSPQSFLQPLSQPIYSRRPEIPITQDAQLTPQTHESGIEPVKAEPRAAGVAGMSGIGGGSGVTAGVMGGIGASVPAKRLPEGVINGRNDAIAVSAEPMPAIAYESAAADSITPSTTTSTYDDYFEYNLSDPVTLRKNESALVPILQAKLPVERVTLWSPSHPRALRALWITNSSSLTLDRGSFSIVENGNFGGEGLLDPIHPAERRLLSYAADQAIRVTPDYSNNTQRVLSFSVVKGVLRQQTTEISEVEYLVHNSATDPRTVIVEQPKRSGWKLDSDPRPAETTPDAYRFRVATAAGESVRLHVGQRHDFELHYRLVNTSDEQLSLILRNANPTILQQLEPILAAKRAISSLDSQIKARQLDINQITDDQKRIRENLSTLKGSTEERSLAKRYTSELNQQEDKLDTLRKELDTLHQQRDTAQQDLDNKIESLHIEQTRS
jgi:hypothetical protein